MLEKQYISSHLTKQKATVNICSLLSKTIWLQMFTTHTYIINFNPVMSCAYFVNLCDTTSYNNIFGIIYAPNNVFSLYKNVKHVVTIAFKCVQMFQSVLPSIWRIGDVNRLICIQKTSFGVFVDKSIILSGKRKCCFRWFSLQSIGHPLRSLRVDTNVECNLS